MVNVLVSRSSGPGSSPGRNIVLCSWARHLTLTVSLSTQVYKRVPANLMLGVTLRWTSIPPRGEYKYYQSLHAMETGISSHLMSHLARMPTLPYLPVAILCLSRLGTKYFSYFNHFAFYGN